MGMYLNRETPDRPDGLSKPSSGSNWGDPPMLIHSHTNPWTSLDFNGHGTKCINHVGAFPPRSRAWRTPMGPWV